MCNESPGALYPGQSLALADRFIRLKCICAPKKIISGGSVEFRKPNQVLDRDGLKTALIPGVHRLCDAKNFRNIPLK